MFVRHRHFWYAMCQNHIPAKKCIYSDNLISDNFSDRPTQKCAGFLKKRSVGRVTGNENIIDDRLRLGVTHISIFPTLDVKMTLWGEGGGQEP